jgi:hypothetical protein
MKVSTILIALIATLFISCKSGSSNSADYSGTYVLQTQGEYAKDFDTLVVSSDQSAKNAYSIQNKSGFQKIRNGVTMPKEYKQTTWVANWNEEKKVLAETDLGRQIQFKNNGNSLVLKNSVYQKIK